ncbi:hypothetical protein D3C78_1419810 [compost metagenome]
MELHVTQHHLGDLAVDFHVQNAGVERFLLQGVPQFVVVGFDGQGFNTTTVDDTGRVARITQTAARTRTLLGALCSDEVHN